MSGSHAGSQDPGAAGRPRVLVTGRAGFIGSHVCERFARAGFAVRVLDDLSSGLAENCAEDWSLVEADVTDAAAVHAAVAGSQVVVHLAAFTSVPESFEHFERCYATNVGGTLTVLEACVRHGVRKLAFASSSAVYAELPDAPKSEDDCPEPISPYAVSKLEGEHLLAAFARAHGLPGAALRFFNVYGARQPADSDYAAAVPIFFERGLAEERVTIYGDGLQTRDFVHVRDVAEAVFRATTGDAGGVLNVGTGVPVTIDRLARAIAGLTSGREDFAHEPQRPGDVRSSTAEVTRMRRALGWQPAVALEEGLADTLRWYAARVTA